MICKSLCTMNSFILFRQQTEEKSRVTSNGSHRCEYFVMMSMMMMPSCHGDSVLCVAVRRIADYSAVLMC